ncbi:deoxyribonuclease-4 [Pullulanibacillus pueri]|uniref:Putative endonuclease 4 n=1 Tax=Pullulanibacillus pueri TaxID=1437324 RepID=A0A8J3ELN7_9BACL|nr:deoxyribonuclease IV [Pullulanibacillus pueri]MBM7681125.1 deoxyribonuclease-4 [Pullulanibacillus pueri]GGH77141.1 putative endonuclease 4 [Pullulanibacillus pueri]
MQFGCHISTRNGYLGAAQVAKKIGAEAFQYFPKNPRSLRTKSFDAKDAERCAAFCQEEGIVSIGHSAYPTNLAAEDNKLQWVMDSVLNDLEITDACGSIGTVVHFASFHGDPIEGYKKMIDTLNRILLKWTGESLILIENNAGKGGQLGLTLEELVKIRELIDQPEKLGFCLDTCHAFASGLWNGEDWSEVENRGEGLGYFKHLKAIHLNNSVYETGSRKDRHANIKKGQIPLEAMKSFICSPSVKKIPMILETPSSKEYSHYDEIQELKKWAR